MEVAYILKRRAPRAWNVPDQRSGCWLSDFVALAIRRCARRSISAAARREKVRSRMRPGSAPFTMRCATRWASVLVLPEPAPAITSSGPATLAPVETTPCSTAQRCASFRLAR
jgi:hypothetical protein